MKKIDGYTGLFEEDSWAVVGLNGEGRFVVSSHDHLDTAERRAKKSEALYPRVEVLYCDGYGNIEQRLHVHRYGHPTGQGMGA